MAATELDVRKLELGVVAGISAAVGNQLSTIKTQTGEKPAVVLERMFAPNGNNPVPPRPDYPYCSVSFVRVVDADASIVNRYFDGDDYIHESIKDCYISVRFYGNRSNSVDSIANRAYMSVEVEGYRNLIQDVSEQSCEVANKSDIRYFDTVNQDIHTEIREFDVVIRTTDIFREINSGYFDTIQFTAEYQR